MTIIELTPVRKWRAQAVCLGADPELFFSDEEEAVDVAKSLCAECPVLRECLGFALDTRQCGTWGGTTEKERDRLRRNKNYRFIICGHCGTPFVAQKGVRYCLKGCKQTNE